MNVEQAEKFLHAPVNSELHGNVMETIDIGWSVVDWKDNLADLEEEYDDYLLKDAIMSHVDTVLDTFWEALEDEEDVWTSRKLIKNGFIDKYDKVFAFLLSNDAFCKDEVAKLYDVFVKFKLKFNEIIMEWTCDDEF